MRIYLVVISIFLFTSLAMGKEYGNYELKRIPTVSESPSGKKYGIDGKYLDQILGDLALHAKNYPPQFDSPQDQQRAVQDAKNLSGLLDILVNGPNPDPEILWRAGLLNNMAYNLDIAGSAEKASAIFQKLLAITPSDPRGNYMYGTFLAGTGKSMEALPYLEKALSAGAPNANYSIGMVYLTLGNKQKAIEHLEAYKKGHPNDSRITTLLDGIRNGKVEIMKTKN